MYLDDVLNRVRVLLHDTRPENYRWGDDILSDWLRDAMFELRTYAPEAFIKFGTVKLTEGVIQDLPKDGKKLVDIIRNTDGAPVKETSRDIMEALLASCDTKSKGIFDERYASKNVKYFINDERLPQGSFMVFPPQPEKSGSVDITYQYKPEADFDPCEELEVPDDYMPALVDYVCYRAMLEDAEHAANAQLATGYYQAFTTKAIASSARNEMDKEQ